LLSPAAYDRGAVGVSGEIMETDFAVLRQYLEAAWLQARGNDETTRKVRSVLDLLIEDVLQAEYTRPRQAADVLALSRRRRAS
jgi:hypothetical protein